MSGRARSASRSGVFVGSFGFSSDSWERFVYAGRPPKGPLLGRYAEFFRAAELDTTYYAIPPVERVVGWREQTPEGFVLTAKVPRTVTQEARLHGPLAAAELERFLDAMRHLGSRLGPIVFQMSSSFRYPAHFTRLVEALRALPSLGGAGLEFAVEFRHASWWQRDEPAALLREHGVAWVWNDWIPTGGAAAGVPRPIDDATALRVTSDRFAYFRLVGDREVGDDREDVDAARRRDLARWAALALEFGHDRDDRAVYLMLNRHYAGPAPLVIREVERLLGLEAKRFPSEEAPARAGAGGGRDGAGSGPGQPRLPGL